MSKPIDQVVVFGSALSTPVRAEILELLTDTGFAVSIANIASILNHPLGHISHHIAILKAMGVVEVTPDGRSKMVRVAPEWEALLVKVFDTVGVGDEEEEEGEYDEPC